MINLVAKYNSLVYISNGEKKVCPGCGCTCPCECTDCEECSSCQDH